MKIMVCVSLTITPEDSLPKLICVRCIDLVNSFYDFREECMNAHMKLIHCGNNEDYEEASSPKAALGEYEGALLPSCDFFIANVVAEAGDEEDSCDQNMQFENGSLETVTIICGKMEDTAEGSTLEKCPDEELESEDIGCMMQLEKVSDTVYILKQVEEDSGVGEQYRCSACMTEFSTQDDFDKHCKECEQVEIPSEAQTVEVKTETPPKRKRARWGEGRTYPCPTCGKVFKVPAMLRTHERVHTGERPFLCSLCSRSFTQLYALRNHELQHRGESPYPCEQCGKGFFRPSDLEKHMRTHTGERPFMCSVCSKSFHQLSGLVVHERIHSGERPYSCSFCPMTCNQWANMQRHEKTHAGGTKPFSCKICNRKFSDSKELELHQAGHGGGRPRVCEYCSKSFRKPSELRQHLQRSHTNERPYHCEFCNKAFFVAHDLKQHVMTHTGERPHECQFCDRTFTQRGNLKETHRTSPQASR
ncbi:hypothetical protein L9F63_014592 [Diploptera punctata]|uniref:Uncharacterized protein n=1 Tax=Diploptera punctata TaxID=6984 RepID=A0AAD8EKX2_DIPPU|nr:hypothetical protein L9F63_014592 [Diploptera punctata]